MEKKIKEKIEMAIKAVEIIICVSILFSLILSIPILVKYAISVIKASDFKQNYDLLNEFLKFALLLVVGIELIEMILTRSHEAILTLILFVIARKMLLYSVDLLDILVGSLSIGLIFVIIKFVVKDDSLMAKIDNTYSAAMTVKKIKEEYKLDIPQDMSNTLGGLVYEIAKVEGINELKENTRLIYGSYKFKIISMKDGVIKRIRIEELK
ncbi:transporter associated domain-containing protein [Anaerococcus ihuae]|uniref:transporter associated domain-containing protein n=1 Tax=Anaerococcus ihuae TaxID=2899519 RepID=UPI001F3BB1B0|nr:transporter associated domain-containing protein [Anaerococcus ihuae]